MFGWRDGSPAVARVVPEAAGGVAVLTRPMLTELLGHRAEGRITQAELATWWTGLLGHEQDFHLARDEHTGPRHDAHAAPLSQVVLVARLRAAAARLATHPVLGALGADPLPAGAPPVAPAASYGEYFGNPDFRASADDRRRYLAAPPVTAYQDAAVHRTLDRLRGEGGLAARIPVADLHAVLVYLTATFREPNAALRSGRGEDIARYETFIRVAVSGFNQLRAVTGATTYRGIWLGRDDIVRLPDTHPVGGLVVDAGLVSTELPDEQPRGTDPTTALRTQYYADSPVTIEVLSRTGRDSWWLARRFGGGRFQELTFIPGSTFLVRDLRITHTETGQLTAHLVWEDVSHLRPPGAETLADLHARLVAARAELLELATADATDPSLPARAQRALERAASLPGDDIPGEAAQACANCGGTLAPDERFCEACGTPLGAPMDSP
jgi:hypothetical protein